MNNINLPSSEGTFIIPTPGQPACLSVDQGLGVPAVTTHSFRKTLATLIDGRGLAARVGADHLRHSKVSMTQDVYMARGKTHTQVAELLDDAINGA